MDAGVSENISGGSGISGGMIVTPHVVFWRGVADLETPVGVLIKLVAGRPNSFLLESVEGGSARGRFSVIGTAPDVIWRSHEGAAEISRHGAAFIPAGEALVSLRALIAESQFALPDGLPPMIGGVFGYLGYDMARQMERLPPSGSDDTGVPDAIMLRPTLFAVFDNVRDELIIASPVRPQTGETHDQAVARAGQKVTAARAALRNPLPVDAPPQALPIIAPPHANMSHDDFIAMVLRMKDFITAGDVFQVVPSQRFTTAFSLPPLALYRALRRINPAPFLFFLDFGDFSIAGSSPEILVRLMEKSPSGRSPAPASAAQPRRKIARWSKNF
jgi:anthranilate synthase component 1